MANSEGLPAKVIEGTVIRVSPRKLFLLCVRSAFILLVLLLLVLALVYWFLQKGELVIHGAILAFATLVGLVCVVPSFLLVWLSRSVVIGSDRLQVLKGKTRVVTQIPYPNIRRLATFRTKIGVQALGIDICIGERDTFWAFGDRGATHGFDVALLDVYAETPEEILERIRAAQRQGENAEPPPPRPPPMPAPTAHDAELGAPLLKMDNLGQRVLLFYCILILVVTAFLGSMVLIYGDIRSLGVGAGLIGVAFLCGFIACTIVGSSLRLHERGVARRGLFGTRRLRYQDLLGIAITPYMSTYSVNFVPISRRRLLELQFLPHPALKLRPIVFLGDFNLMQEVVEILDKGPGRFPYRLLQAVSLAQSGEHSRATAEAEDLVKTGPTDALFLYNIACVFSTSCSKCEDAAVAERYAIRAIALLRQAVAQGWVEAAHMQNDPDLDSLRKRDEFKTLIAELEAAKAATHP
jgi:hypothetical protein